MTGGGSVVVSSFCALFEAGVPAFGDGDGDGVGVLVLEEEVGEGPSPMAT